MSCTIHLNGDDWKLTGWWKNQWRLLSNMELGISPISAVPTISAKVPGAAQADLMKAGMLADPNYGVDSTLGEWVNNREWFYDKEFSIPGDVQGEKFILCFDGLDYHGEIYLNGKKLTEFYGMFIPVEVDVTGIIRRNASNYLRVVFYTDPEVDGQIGYSSRIRILKSRFNYVWDWCPRIVPVGIWDDVYLKVYNYVRITDFFPKAAADVESKTGKISVNTEITADMSGEYEFIYRISQNGKEFMAKSVTENLVAAKQHVSHEISVKDIELWWPNNSGEQPLYDIELTVISKNGRTCDRASKRIGFRNAEFVQNEDAPDGAMPYTLVLNGRRIFLRGVDWVPISPLYGSVTRDDYRNYLQRFKDMNCNILRVWGGAILEKKDFYDICDEMGIMVWQEFPQSSSGLDNTPPDDPDLLEELKKVSAVFIKRRRHHASHIIWCGGNELMWENFKPVNENHINIKMLKDLVEEMDPGKYFLPSSASGPVFVAKEEDFGKGVHHDVHGPWNYMGEPDHYRFFNGDDSLFRSETGCPGISRLEALEKYRGNFNVWPPDERNHYWVHRGSWWLQMEQLTKLFGEWKDTGEEIGQYVMASRFIQAEALRYAAEATRRREPASSGFIIWMGNEPFPNNANTSVIEYDGTPKPAYYWVKNAFAPLHVSVKYNKVCYSSGETFAGEVYVNDDLYEAKNLKVTAQIIDLEGKGLYEKTWEIATVTPILKVGTIEWPVECCKNNMFFLRVTLQNGAETLDENTYLFTADCEQPFQPLRNLPACEIKVEMAREDNREEWIIANTSTEAAVGVFLYGKDPAQFLGISPGHFILMPGEKRKVYIYSNTSFSGDNIPFKIEAFNLRALYI